MYLLEFRKLTSALHYAMVYECQRLYRVISLWTFDDAANVSSQYLVYGILAFQRKPPF